MALGGGTFLTQNKILPGSYINFISAAKAAGTLSERGLAAMPLLLDWGIEGRVFKVDAEQFNKDSLKIFGYGNGHEKLKGLRDLFKNIRAGYFYRLNGGEKAACTYAEAKYSGVRGNDIKIVISKNVDNDSLYDVQTLVGTLKVDLQTVAVMADLKANDFVDFKAAAEISVTSGTPLSGGTNGEAVTGEEYQLFLDKIEPFSFNTLGCPSTSTEINNLFVQFTRRMREEAGVKFQTVVYRTEADFEGVINLQNEVTGDSNPASLVYWTTGAAAGCAVNKSNTNRIYDGEFKVKADYRQAELEEAIRGGKFILHRVGDSIRVLTDINSFTSFNEDKNGNFGSNQTIRVLDQIANDIAVLFNTKYCGSMPNDPAGRISLWNDIVRQHQELEKIRAIENFNPEDVVISKGEDKKAVVIQDAVTITNAMEQLYMLTIIQ
ncbi:phage tail sheath protein [Ruminiclostridium hungatei]|uniref:Phage tail sheath protein n=1 Tax=Ruminiclostridium hungatei TaxID=48256 RepID=A0A1V4SKR1_RUMHU|nr:phage tail sheath family protein [Ruminiclostridium hungatei]OPX43827.1 phage tail sheath protein [Ruminiclostridium hungatei]